MNKELDNAKSFLLTLINAHSLPRQVIMYRAARAGLSEFAVQHAAKALGMIKFRVSKMLEHWQLQETIPPHWNENRYSFV